jgi:hypothetical protein
MRDQGSSPQPQCFFGSLLVANYGIVDPPGDRTRDDDDDDMSAVLVQLFQVAFSAPSLDRITLSQL